MMRCYLSLLWMFSVFLLVEALQLVDGPSPLEGRLEAGLFGQLQAVYGRTFDEKAANVTCTSLGYPHVGFATRAHPGKNLHYYKQNIVCQGHEKYIEECQGELKYCVEQRYYHCTIMSNSLTHVALFCSDYTLENISLSATGVIQVGVNGQIWAVCDAYFTPETANSVCTVLGFHGTESFDVKTTGDNSVIEILGSIICKPNATSVIDCHIKHQFSYRPYDSSAECRNYVLLTCN
ncbi:C163B-like protein [Mya arenaria]|uniref:C163B-like protein n=1 Tax=Mya arenaria TaxID=6604 RepID=A0ABY7GAX0_MYAAR|nr:C163B-like protein [Mya arenaria]